MKKIILLLLLSGCNHTFEKEKVDWGSLRYPKVAMLVQEDDHYISITGNH